MNARDSRGPARLACDILSFSESCAFRSLQFHDLERFARPDSEVDGFIVLLARKQTSGTVNARSHSLN